MGDYNTVFCFIRGLTDASIILIVKKALLGELLYLATTVIN